MCNDKDNVKRCEPPLPNLNFANTFYICLGPNHQVLRPPIFVGIWYLYYHGHKPLYPRAIVPMTHSQGLIDSLDSLPEEGNIRMLALFDNEEVCNIS